MSQRAVVVAAARTPIGRRNGGLSTVHAADLLATVMLTSLGRAGVEPQMVEQALCGCVGQVGMQSFNVGRTAWLTAGLPDSTPAITLDGQCGSSQHATHLAQALIESGAIEMALACGVEVMSRVPIGASSGKQLGFGSALPRSYLSQIEFTTQFEAAERIARHWKVTRTEADELALTSQRRAALAWERGRFEAQIAAVSVPERPVTAEEAPNHVIVGRDECLRSTSLEALASLAPVVGESGVHTAGSASQIADGAAAVLLTSERRAVELGLDPLALLVDSCLVGVDPVMMLTGPIEATRRLLDRNGLTVADIDLFEINEAFASVVLAFERELGVDPALVNPNGGAIALGHPLGATGAMLVTKAVHELARSGKRRAVISMCCGGGLGTAALVERG